MSFALTNLRGSGSNSVLVGRYGGGAERREAGRPKGEEGCAEL